MPPKTASSRTKGLLPVWVLLGAITSLAPLAVGSVHNAVIALMGAASGVLVVLLARARKLQSRRFAPGALPLVVIAGAAWSLVQCIPLPMPLLRLVAPSAAQLWDVMAQNGSPSWGSISTAPITTLITAAQLLTFAAVLAVALDLTREKEGRRHLTQLAALSGLLVMGAGIVHGVMGFEGPFGIFPNPSVPIFRSTFINSNHAAAALIIGAFGCFGAALTSTDRKTMLNASLGALGCVVALFLCGSNGAAIGVVAGTAVACGLLWRSLKTRPRSDGDSVVAARRGSRTLAIVAMATVLPMMFLALHAQELLGIRDGIVGALSLKVESFEQALTALPDYWLTGMGRGAFADVFPRHKTSMRPYTFTAPENIELLLAVEWGVLFAAVYMIAFSSFIVRWLRRQQGVLGIAPIGGIVALAVHNQADFNLEILGVALPFTLLLAAAREDPEPTDMPADERRRLARVSSSWAMRAGFAAALLLGLPGLVGMRWGMRPDFNRAVATEALPARVDAIRAHMKRHPTDYLAAITLARTMRRVNPNETQEPLRWVNRAMFLNPTLPDVHADAARILWDAGRHEQSALEFAAAEKCGPTWHPIVHFQELLNRGLTLDQLWTVYSGKGQRWVCDTLLDLGRAGLGEACLRELSTQNPGDSTLLTSLAERALWRGDLGGAEKYARGALDIDPGLGGAALALSRVMREEGKVQESDAILERARENRADPVEVDRERFERAMAAGQLDRARAVLVQLSKAIQRREGKMAEVMFMEGRVEEKAGNLQQAVLHYRNAARANPDDPAAALAASRISVQLGDEEGALGIVREVSLMNAHPAYLARMNELANRHRGRP